MVLRISRPSAGIRVAGRLAWSRGGSDYLRGRIDLYVDNGALQYFFVADGCSDPSHFTPESQVPPGFQLR